MAELSNAELAHRAALMSLWKKEESFALFRSLLLEMHTKNLVYMRKGSKDTFERYCGYLEAIEDVLGMADAIIRDHRVRSENNG